tara:strand:+ start:8220 stop:8567 length:348 start_codon:yes stop_codon:yes gene_type:complete
MSIDTKELIIDDIKEAASKLELTIFDHRVKVLRDTIVKEKKASEIRIGDKFAYTNMHTHHTFMVVEVISDGNTMYSAVIIETKYRSQLGKMWSFPVNNVNDVFNRHMVENRLRKL